MRITKPRRPGDMIIVDLVKPSTLSPDGWLKPIEFELNDPPTLYVRVPHGQFAVRVMSTADTELMIHIDGQKVLDTRVSKGIHIFERDSEGRPFAYGRAPVVGETPELEQQTLFGSDEEAECVKTHGQVAVHVRFADEQGPDGCPRPGVSRDFSHPVFFQMNPPGEHEEALAGLLRRMKAPPKLTEADDIFSENGDAKPLPKRMCINCGHEH